MIDKENKRLYGSNVEIYYTEILKINDTLCRITEMDDKIIFSFVDDIYHVKGQTNLQKNEFVKILENIKLY
ncbi:MAG: hypothetical protein J6K99_06225, partial [Peptococcaceae bacterium]|nr:hypothetical protein [Peptococcaceae bacterium]MBP3624364.1 hypothetical protein [Peptococcaceae bacterium]